MMTELELSLTLGVVTEPVKNRVNVDPLLEVEIMFLKQIFQIARIQRDEVGHANPDAWADLLPWHSLN
ncbi:MAG: hypothetical protein VKJ04_11355 [Vampirovibrionales bacterium]|nr:hypothetical protein [Vampirovibrionales bacterium]